MAGPSDRSGRVGFSGAGLERIHDNHARLPEMGQRSQQFAAAYSAELWADRWTEMCIGAEKTDQTFA